MSVLWVDRSGIDDHDAGPGVQGQDIRGLGTGAPDNDGALRKMDHFDLRPGRSLAGDPEGKGGEEEKGVRLRLLTYNIHHAEGTDGRLDLERVARVIKEVKPDLVAVQRAAVAAGTDAGRAAKAVMDGLERP